MSTGCHRCVSVHCVVPMLKDKRWTGLARSCFRSIIDSSTHRTGPGRPGVTRQDDFRIRQDQNMPGIMQIRPQHSARLSNRTSGLGKQTNKNYPCKSRAVWLGGSGDPRQAIPRQKRIDLNYEVKSPSSLRELGLDAWRDILTNSSVQNRLESQMGRRRDIWGFNFNVTPRLGRLDWERSILRRDQNMHAKATTCNNKFVIRQLARLRLSSGHLWDEIRQSEYSCVWTLSRQWWPFV